MTLRRADTSCHGVRLLGGNGSIPLDRENPVLDLRGANLLSWESSTARRFKVSLMAVSTRSWEAIIWCWREFSVHHVIRNLTVGRVNGVLPAPPRSTMKASGGPA